MGSNERREREKQEVRTKILDAARELFSKEGYEAVTMRKIAEKIEYSATAIYFHFKDKEDLIRELCTHDFLEFAQIFLKIAKVADLRERMRRSATAYLDFALTHPNQYRLMFMTPPPLAPTEREDLTRGNPEQDAYAFLEANVRELVEQKLLRPELKDPALVAQTIWAGLHGVAALYVARTGDGWLELRPVKTATRFMVETLMRGLFVEEA